jgi:hypothetical protein
MPEKNIYVNKSSVIEKGADTAAFKSLARGEREAIFQSDD